MPNFNTFRRRLDFPLIVVPFRSIALRVRMEAHPPYYRCPERGRQLQYACLVSTVPPPWRVGWSVIWALYILVIPLIAISLQISQIILSDENEVCSTQKTEVPIWLQNMTTIVAHVSARCSFPSTCTRMIDFSKDFHEARHMPQFGTTYPDGMFYMELAVSRQDLLSASSGVTCF